MMFVNFFVSNIIEDLMVEFMNILDTDYEAQ